MSGPTIAFHGLAFVFYKHVLDKRKNKRHPQKLFDLLEEKKQKSRKEEVGYKKKREREN